MKSLHTITVTILMIIAGVLSLAASQTSTEPGAAESEVKTFDVDPVHSATIFRVQHLGATHLRARELEVAAAEVQLGPHRPRDVEREASDDEHLTRRLVDRVHGIRRARHAIDESHDAVSVVTDEVAAEHVDGLGRYRDRLGIFRRGIFLRVRVIGDPWWSWNISRGKAVHRT